MDVGRDARFEGRGQPGRLRSVGAELPGGASPLEQASDEDASGRDRKRELRDQEIVDRQACRCRPGPWLAGRHCASASRRRSARGLPPALRSGICC